MSGFEALLTGRVLADRYRIEEVIGRGGMGAVYRAKDERLGRPVAVKVITVTGAGDAEARDRLRARFRHEASSAARLPHHPNVVPVYDYGTDPTLGLDFLVMELLRGEDLASRLGRLGAPPLRAALRILEQAARGVAVGHRAGIIHRDVKPGNVFLVESDEREGLQVRVLDFGIAKLIDTEDTYTQLTHDGRAPLSPAYASPEQLAGGERLTAASDVFSLGALGFQLLSGDRPFTENDRNRMSVGMEVPLPSLKARNPEVPDDVEAALRKALAYDPADRFPDAGAFADVLHRLITGQPVPPEALLPGTGAGGLPSPAPSSAAGGVATAFAGPAPSLPGGDDGDDRTMLAPIPRPTPLAREEPRPAGAVAGGHAIPPRRGRRRKRGSPALWVLGLGTAGLVGGMVVWMATDNDRARDISGELGDLPDSVAVVVDSTVADSAPVLLDARMAFIEGRRLLRARDFAGALELFRQAVEQDADNPEYADHFAFALINLGRAPEAVPHLERAIRQDPAYDLAYSHLADARLAMGDTAAAVQALNEFLRVSLNRPARELVQRRLEALTEPEVVIEAPPPPVDSIAIPSRPDTTQAPRDSIRIPSPR